MMKTYIALLRGIGGKYTFPMKELVVLLEKTGLRQVKTYIASGNVLFKSRAEAPALADKISKIIDKNFGFAPHVVVLTPEQLKRAIKQNPFPEAELAPTTLHISFMNSAPKSPDIEKLETLKAPGEQFLLKDKAFYVHTPDGAGRSKLFTRMEKSLGVPATARNWRSVCKLQSLADELEKARQ